MYKSRFSFHFHFTSQMVASVIRRKPVSNIPDVDDVVLCKITKINMRMAYADILSIEGSTLTGTFPGVIRYVEAII